MSRDYRTLRVFALADTLALDIYQATRDFPRTEQFGLQAQIRCAAVSAVANIVEGSARRTGSEYVNFLSVAHGSAAEACYLVDLALRLKFIKPDVATKLGERYTTLLKGLNVFTRTVGADKT